MEIRPILSAMWRNRVAPILLGLEIAITLAVMVNAMFIVEQRMEARARPTGADTENTAYVRLYHVGRDTEAMTQTLARDMREIRAMDGVLAASMSNQLPAGGSGWSSTLETALEDGNSHNVSLYWGGPQLLHAFGGELASGRLPDDQQISIRPTGTTDVPKEALLSEAAATALYPDESPLGKPLYLEPNIPPVTIVGTIKRMQAPWPQWDNVESVILLPMPLGDGFYNYVIRAEPGRRDAVLAAVEERLLEIDSDRVVLGSGTFAEVKARAYETDTAVSRLLLVVVIALTVITGLGIVGLTQFWISKRRRQIGVRRALGAQRSDILRYFLTENLIITSSAVALGLVMAVGLNYWLIANVGGERLSWHHPIIGAVVILLLGVLSVIGPARRATLIPPAVATRAA